MWADARLVASHSAPGSPFAKRGGVPGQTRIAVAGVSRDSKQPANLIYRRLRATGHEVFAVDPNADEVEGDVCYAT